MTEKQLQKKKEREYTKGKLIAEYLIKTGKTQRDAAKDLGISLGSLVTYLKIYKNNNEKAAEALLQVSENNRHHHKVDIDILKKITSHILENNASFRETSKALGYHQGTVARYVNIAINEELLEPAKREQLLKIKDYHTTEKGKKR